MSSDTLSEVLRAVRLKGAVFFSVQAGAPWVAEAPTAATLAPHVMPDAEHVIEYHAVTAGQCYGGLLDGPAIPLSAGDIIVFPQGDAHVMASAPDMRGDPTWGFSPEQTASLPIALSLGAADTQDTHVICGFLGCDARPFNPLLESLPRVMVLRGEQRRGRLSLLVELALTESTARGSGSDSVLARVSELLFIEVVRRHIASLSSQQTGWLAGLRDELVGRCLMRLHDRPAHAWTLEELAQQVGSSRSVVAERFTQLVGIPPMQYLARWRMQLAAGLLSEGSKSLSEVASQVGYGSETALSRAFKRELGVAPAQYRRGLKLVR